MPTDQISEIVPPGHARTAQVLEIVLPGHAPRAKVLERMLPAHGQAPGPDLPTPIRLCVWPVCIFVNTRNPSQHITAYHKSFIVSGCGWEKHCLTTGWGWRAACGGDASGADGRPVSPTSESQRRPEVLPRGTGRPTPQRKLSNLRRLLASKRRPRGMGAKPRPTLKRRERAPDCVRPWPQSRKLWGLSRKLLLKQEPAQHVHCQRPWLGPSRGNSGACRGNLP